MKGRLFQGRYGRFHHDIIPNKHCVTDSTNNESQLDQMASASIKNKIGLHPLSRGPLLSVLQQQENCLPNPRAEFLLCSRAFTDPPGVWQQRWKTIIKPECKVFLCRRCVKVPDISSVAQAEARIFERRSVKFSQTSILHLSIWSEHKDTFLSHDSEDKGHWVTYKLTPNTCWFRGLSRVCTHTDTHI